MTERLLCIPTYLGKESPNVSSEENHCRNNEEWTLAPDVCSSSGKERGEADPESEKSDDETRNHVNTDVVLLCEKRETGCHHWSEAMLVSVCEEQIMIEELTLLSRRS